MRLESKAQGSELLRFWKILLMAEEALGKSLQPIPPKVAEMEGRPYFKIPFESLSEASAGQEFVLRKTASLTLPPDKEIQPFLLYNQHLEKERKRFRIESERVFMLGFPSLLVKDAWGKEKLLCLIKFPLAGMKVQPVKGGLEEVVLIQEVFQPKKGEVPYWFDELFFSEGLGVMDEKLQAFRKAITQEKRDALGFLEQLTALLLNQQLDNSRPFDSLMEALQAYLMELQHTSMKVPKIYPVALFYELEENQPTRQLQNDLDEILSEEFLEELSPKNPASQFLFGKPATPPQQANLLAQVGPQGMTISQQAAAQEALANPLTIIQGPPGTGKTHLIRNLMAQRLVDFALNLSEPEDRAYDLHHLTLILSTNNRAVDNALEGLEEPGFLPLTLRVGSRPVLQNVTLPFLKSVAAELERRKSKEGRDRFAQQRQEFVKLYRAAQEQEPTPKERQELYRAARELHDAWVSANRQKLLELLEELMAEIDERRGLKSLKMRKNLQLLFTAFPLVGCTLLSLRNLFELEESSLGLVLIDEAGQCLPSYMFPGLYRAKQAVILGDTKQLEPVVRLKEAEIRGLWTHRKIKLALETCLHFAATAENPQSGQQVAEDLGGVLSLREHFRCRPEIIQTAQELCGYDLSIKTKSAPVPALAYRSVQGQEIAYGGSWYNEAEVEAAIKILERFLAQGFAPQEIALLTPYRGQLQHLNHALRRARLNYQVGDQGEEGQNAIATGTVHRFQGGERKIVIFSPVISMGQPTFLNSRVNLINVALTRAMEQFVLVGNLEALERGPLTKIIRQRLLQVGVAI